MGVKQYDFPISIFFTILRIFLISIQILFIAYFFFIVCKLFPKSAILKGFLIYFTIILDYFLVSKLYPNSHINCFGDLLIYGLWVIWVYINTGMVLVRFKKGFICVLRGFRVTSRKFAILILDETSILNPKNVNALIIFFCMHELFGPSLLGDIYDSIYVITPPGPD